MHTAMPPPFGESVSYCGDETQLFAAFIHVHGSNMFKQVAQ